MGGGRRNRGGDGGQVGGQGSGRGNYGRSPGRPGRDGGSIGKAAREMEAFSTRMCLASGAPKTGKENGKDQAVSPHREGTQGVSELSGVGMSDQNWDSQAGEGAGNWSQSTGLGSPSSSLGTDPRSCGWGPVLRPPVLRPPVLSYPLSRVGPESETDAANTGVSPGCR